jgi:hypothetical protein
MNTPPCGHRTAFEDLLHDRAADDVARRAFTARVVVEHEALAFAVQQKAAQTAQALFEHGAGHARVFARKQSGRMELNHFHVAQRKAGAQCHRHAVAGLVARWRVVFVHRWAAAGGEQRVSRAHEQQFARTHVEHQHARQTRSVGGRHKIERAVILEPPHIAPPDLLGEAIDDLDAGEIALVHRAVERLSGKRLLMDRSVRIAVEEAAELVLQLADARARLRDEQPGEILIVQPRAAFDRVHEVALDGIGGRKCHVVAALHHARAAAFAEQALHRNRDVEVRIGALRVKRRE